MWAWRVFLWLLPGNQLTKDAKEGPCGECARAPTVYKSACSNYCGSKFNLEISPEKYFGV